jgi:hypothetical protein
MTVRLLKACPKGNIMNCWENPLIQTTAKEGQLIPEQTSYEHNISYALATTFSVFCLCTYLCCFVVILFLCVFLCFVVVLCIFIFVCTSVGLLPPGESPIAVVVVVVVVVVTTNNKRDSQQDEKPNETQITCMMKTRNIATNNSTTHSATNKHVNSHFN